MNEFTSSSPQHSDLISEENDVSSLKETTLLNQPLNNVKNIKIVKIEQKLTQSSKAKGRKTLAFWTLVILLFLLAIGNLILTMTILGVLKIGNGMQSIEILPEDKSIKLFGNVDLDRIFKQNNGVMQGFDTENVEVTAEDNSMLINIYSKSNRVSNKVILNKNQTNFNGLKSFTVRNAEKKLIFDTSKPSYNNLKNINNFKAKSVSTSKIRSKLDEDLKIESDIIHLKGNEGIKIEAREIVWSADQDIYLRSINGSIILSGKEGTYVDIERLPLARLDKRNYATAQFKICVCMPQGKLFRVPVASIEEPVYCHQADMTEKHNPCL